MHTHYSAKDSIWQLALSIGAAGHQSCHKYVMGVLPSLALCCRPPILDIHLPCPNSLL
jgi:hypothetical protein